MGYFEKMEVISYHLINIVKKNWNNNSIKNLKNSYLSNIEQITQACSEFFLQNSVSCVFFMLISGKY